MKIYLCLFLSLFTFFIAYSKKIAPKKEISKAISEEILEDKKEIEEIPVHEELEIPPVEQEIKEEVEKPQEVHTFKDALENAKKSNSNIFLYFGNIDCKYCEQMKYTTFTNKFVIEKLSNYTVLKIDTNNDPERVSSKYSVLGIPAYMILDKDGKTLKRTSGFKNNIDFISWIGE